MSPLRTFIPGLVTKTPNGWHGHWAVKHGRVKREREAVQLALLTLGRHAIYDPIVVTMTRCSAHALDDDNAVTSFKHVRDQVADWLGINDRDPRVTWKVEQRKVKRAEAGTEIRIERRE